MTVARGILWSRAAVALMILMPACSLPTDEGVTPIDADELPPALANTTTTSTTTTVPTTLPPPPTSEPTETAPSTSTSTTVPPLTTPVNIFYTDNASNGMQGLRRLLLEPVTLQSVINQLETPPPDLASYGVRTSLVPDLINETVLDRSVLTVSLNGAIFETLSDDEKRQAIAQMVLTFTSFAVPGAGNVGSVVFQVDGTPIPVFIPTDGTTREQGQPVYFADFASLVLGTTGTSDSTSVPPSSSLPGPTTTAG